jgi:hypothetical protein
MKWFSIVREMRLQRIDGLRRCRESNELPAPVTDEPYPWLVHGPVRHDPFKEARRAMDRREERRFVRQAKSYFIQA